jgi:xanthine dehydrogenase large subunit
MPPRDAVLEAPLRHVYKPLPHDSGAKHVQGSAEYIDDMPEPVGTMHIAVGGSPVARGTIRRIDLAEVLSTPGVVAVITAAHIPGKNDISPGHADEPVFAHDRVDFHGQPIFAVIATSRDTARVVRNEPLARFFSQGIFEWPRLRYIQQAAPDRSL